MSTETPLFDAIVAKLGYDPLADTNEAPLADTNEAPPAEVGGESASGGATPWQSSEADAGSTEEDMDAVPRRVNRDTANPQATATAETEETP